MRGTYPEVRTYSVDFLVGILLKRLLGKNTEITNVPVAIILAVQEHLALR